MKAHEAFAHAREHDMWFRPRSWSGSGQALTWKPDGSVLLVPTARGGEPAIMSTDFFVSDWEAVSPDVVLGEREDR